MKLVLSKQELGMFQKGVYKIRAVVPLIQGPYIEEFIMNKEELDEWLESYEEHDIFIVSVDLIA